jgi:CheY-like chemotaxis protein
MRRTSRLIGRLTIAAVFMACLCTVAAVAQEEPLRPQLKSKFKNALTLYNAGQYADAATALDEVLQLQPTAREALILRETAGIAILIEMLRDPQLGPAARMILRAAEKEAASIQRDPATIKAVVEQMGSDDVVQRWAAIHKLVAIGPFAVPYVLEYALDETLPELGSRKVSAVIVLQNMGSTAVPPLIAAMVNTTPRDAALIAALLTKLPDARAVPPLLALAQDAARPEFLRNAANDALEALNLNTALPAAQAYYELAKRYYYGDPTLIELTPMIERVLWRWNAEGEGYSAKLTYLGASEAAYARLQAQATLLEGMKQPHDSLDLVELYASNNYMQLAESSEGVTEAGRLEDLRKAPAVNEALGAAAIYLSLDRALTDGNIDLARLDVEALRRINDPRMPTVNSLVTALDFPDKVVRVSAAETLMHLNPLGELDGAEKAVAVLAAGLGAPVRQRILILSEDEGLWRHWSETLRDAGMEPLGYQDLTEAARRVKEGVPRISAVIADTRMDGVLVVARSLGDDARSSDVPVVLVSPTAEMENMRNELGAGIVAILPDNAETEAMLKTVSSAALAASSLATEDIREDLALVKRVLATLAALPGNSAYPASGLAKPAAGLLPGMDNEVRTLALRAIANLPDPSLLDTVYGIFANTEEGDALREEAGRAFLSTLVIAPELTQEQRTTLLNMSADGESVLRWQAVHALSIADLPLADRESRLPELGLTVRP